MFPLCTYQSPQDCEPSSSTLVSCSKMQRNITILISSDFHLQGFHQTSSSKLTLTYSRLENVSMLSILYGSWSLSSLNIAKAWSISEIEMGTIALFMLTLYISWNDATPPKRWRTYLWYCGRQQQSGRWCKCSSRSQLQSGSGISAVLLWSFVTLCTCEPWRSL